MHSIKLRIHRRLPFQKDAIRIETADEAEGIHNKLKEVYIEHKYKIIEVPVMPVKERADYILNHVREIEGGK